MSTRGDRKTSTKKNLTTKGLHGCKTKAASRRGLFNTVERMAQSISRKISAAVDSISLANGGLGYKPSFEQLENRQMLAVLTGIVPNHWIKYDSSNANPNDVDVIALAGTTSAGVTIDVTETDGGG